MRVDILAQLAVQGAMISRLSSDSRRCGPGVAFLAYRGEAADGRQHIPDAIARGASAVLWEKADFAWREEWRVANLPVAALKEKASELAGELYGRPSDNLWVCGVTGTNGKTSCSQWIAASLGVKAGVIGTIGAGFPGALAPLPNTTPDAVEIQWLLKTFRDQGATAAAMEVSSHGLAQGRVNGVRFACALFTNLSHDHLDYHGTMAAYGEAKARLFEMPGLDAAVLNLDDAFGVELARRLRGRVRTIGYSVTGVQGGDEYIVADDALNIRSSWGSARATIPQLGRFNVANALGVLGCLMAKGIPFDEGVRRLAQLPPVPGRMQAVGDAPLVVIDYAHTPDALENVLNALRPVAARRGGRLAVVFGAGGDRDPTKRPLMGAIAARLADRVLVTSDNPRSEDPLAIIEAIRAGGHRTQRVQDVLQRGGRLAVVFGAGGDRDPTKRPLMGAIAARLADRVLITSDNPRSEDPRAIIEAIRAGGASDFEVDRAAAIDRMVAAAEDEDVILIAGKGHENYQEIAGRRTHFSDEEQARAALERRRAK